jgi:hypothetical protein
MSVGELDSEWDASKSSTTGKIVERSLKANKRLLDMDDSLGDTTTAYPGNLPPQLLPQQLQTSSTDLYKANDVLNHERNEELIEYNANKFWRDTSYEDIELEDL